MSKAAAPTFGERVGGRSYASRPGAYAIIMDAGQIAVIRARTGQCFLPGGGIEEGETVEVALAREVREECGWTIKTATKVGEALQYIETEREGCFALHCTFFKVRIAGSFRSRVDDDDSETIEWLAPHDAMTRLVRECDVWAIAEAVAFGA